VTVLPEAAAATLFSPVRIGALRLPHRLVMAPMTRNRSNRDGTPTPLNALYYAQRAGAALIVSEGTQPSPRGQGYPDTPGLHTDGQQAGWAAVASAVHAAGGRIAVQLMHAGRVSHPSVQPAGELPVAPSPVTPAGQVFTYDGMRPYETPRALTGREISEIVTEHAQAARRAGAAGLDGVEIHAGNGYLLHQFLATGTNQRTDAYGGTPANRIRLVLEVAEAVCAEMGADRVGVRVSPGGPVNDMSDAEAEETHVLLVRELRRLGIAWLHLVEPPADAGFSALRLLRHEWPAALIANGSFDPVTAAEAITQGGADAVSFGRLFAANPDLPARLLAGTPLYEADRATFYGGDERGYTDYPFLAEVQRDSTAIDLRAHEKERSA
jgi:N-ethylmaleimide reductase